MNGSDTMYRKQESDSQNNSSRPDYSTVAPPQNLDRFASKPLIPRQSVPQAYEASSSSSFARPKRISNFDEDYFDDDEEVVESEKVEDDEEDALDAFMADLEKSDCEKKGERSTKSMGGKKKERKGVRDDREGG